MPCRLYRSALPLLLVFLCSTVPAPRAPALTPDQIVLVVNRNLPAGVELAEFYAKQRGIPDGRVVAVNLPFHPKVEEVSPAQYEFAVARVVREFLVKNGLEKQVTCLVTFYGVPLRIRARKNTPAEARELAGLDEEAKRVRAEIESVLAEAEKLAGEVDAGFQAGKGTELTDLARRADAALGTRTVNRALAVAGAERRRGLGRRWVGLVGRIAGPLQVDEFRARPELAGLVDRPVTPEQLRASRARAAELQKQLAAARYDVALDAEARQTMRTVLREHFGLLRYAEAVESQRLILSETETAAALDSELALLWWGHHPRAKWQTNLLHYKLAGRVPAGAPPTLMVMRLDGPSPQVVKDIITASVEVERQGLSGRIVLDGRGMNGDDGYGQYDKTIRRLAALLKEKTKLDVTFDDQPAVLQPPNASGVLVENVAAYCGWYSVGNYVPALRFRRGAVAYHVASFELTSLRDPNNRGWVRGLLLAGVASSLGPVAEPYLHSFPPADEFFPLLFTGRLTLAEVYWKTTPLTSWMNTCIGDPLYTPYRVNPPLRAEDLPEGLRRVVGN